jgi:hypothetical protein
VPLLAARNDTEEQAGDRDTGTVIDQAGPIDHETLCRVREIEAPQFSWCRKRSLDVSSWHRASADYLANIRCGSQADIDADSPPCPRLQAVELENWSLK